MMKPSLGWFYVIFVRLNISLQEASKIIVNYYRNLMKNWVTGSVNVILRILAKNLQQSHLKIFLSKDCL